MAPANEAVTYDLNAGGVAAALYAPTRVIGSRYLRWRRSEAIVWIAGHLESIGTVQSPTAYQAAATRDDSQCKARADSDCRRAKAKAWR